MMSEGAAFIIRNILEAGGPVGQIVEGRGPYRGFAWKTGTSFGFRDAWSAGVSNRYTVGVWIGRPDGTPNPGFFGANVAAPLLADIFFALPDGLSTMINSPTAERDSRARLLAAWRPRCGHSGIFVSGSAHSMVAGWRRAADVPGSFQKWPANRYLHA